MYSAAAINFKTLKIDENRANPFTHEVFFKFLAHFGLMAHEKALK